MKPLIVYHPAYSSLAGARHATPLQLKPHDLTPLIVALSFAVLVFCNAAPAAGEGSDQGEVLSALEDVDNAMRLINEELASRQKEYRSIQASIERTDAEIAAEAARVESMKKGLAGSIRAMHSFGRPGYISLLLSSTDFGETIRRAEYIRRLAVRERELLVEYEANAARLDIARADLEKRRKKSYNDGLALGERLKRVSEIRSRRIELLKRVAGDPGIAAAVARDGRKTEKGFERAVAMYAGQAAAGAGKAGFASLRGALPWPVDGVLESGYGIVEDGMYGTKKKRNGWDIRARFLADVRAVADGRVAYSGWLRGYGNVLIVDHGDGYLTIMAHLARSEKNEGDPAVRGEIVAYVGDTGSAKGAYLYFEIRRHGRPVDPGEWMEHADQGDNTD